MKIYCQYCDKEIYYCRQLNGYIHSKSNRMSCDLKATPGVVKGENTVRGLAWLIL